MAKIRNALFSLGASGTVANLLTVHPHGKGQTARRKPSGYGPPTEHQAEMRQRVRDAATTWRALDQIQRAKWIALAVGRATTPFAKYTLEWMAQSATIATPPRIPMA